MAAYGMKGTGKDSRDVALAASQGSRRDTPTNEFTFVKLERPGERGSLRTITILHQRWVTATGRKYWREIGCITQRQMEVENAAYEGVHATT